MDDDHIKNKINELIYQLARCLEILFSVIILLVITLSIGPLLKDLFQTSLPIMERGAFTDFLGDALTLVVGAEFVKMLCKHTPETLLEVLMFATARQMVVEHLDTTQTLIGVLAIAALFATQKYLTTPKEDHQKIHNERTSVKKTGADG